MKSRVSFCGVKTRPLKGHEKYSNALIEFFAVGIALWPFCQLGFQSGFIALWLGGFIYMIVFPPYTPYDPDLEEFRKKHNIKIGESRSDIIKLYLVNAILGIIGGVILRIPIMMLAHAGKL